MSQEDGTYFKKLIFDFLHENGFHSEWAEWTEEDCVKLASLIDNGAIARIGELQKECNSMYNALTKRIYP